jgi:hypothetical protein
LLSNLLIFYNTEMITQALQELLREGHAIDIASVAATNPYMTRYTDRFGHYNVNLSIKPPKLDYDSPILTDAASLQSTA